MVIPVANYKGDFFFIWEVCFGEARKVSITISYLYAFVLGVSGPFFSFFFGVQGLAESMPR